MKKLLITLFLSMFYFNAFASMTNIGSPLIKDQLIITYCDPYDWRCWPDTSVYPDPLCLPSGECAVPT